MSQPEPCSCDEALALRAQLEHAVQVERDRCTALVHRWRDHLEDPAGTLLLLDIESGAMP